MPNNMIENVRRACCTLSILFPSLLIPIAIAGCSEEKAYIPAPGDNPPAPPAESESQGTTQSGSLQGEVK